VAPGLRLALDLGERVAAGGDGIGRLPDGRVVFVEGALPRESVIAEVTDVRRDFARARLTRVEVASPWRVLAPCPHRRRGCGGCPWQEVAPDGAIELKEAIVLDAIRRIARSEPDEVLPTVRLATSGYRTTVHLAVDGDGRPGYRRRHEHAAFAVDSCLVAHPRIDELLAEARFPGHQAVSLRVGIAGGERLAVLARPAPPSSGRDSSGRDSSGRDRPRLPPDVRVVGPGANAVVHELVADRIWRVSARAFFQAGPAAADALVAAVDAAVGAALGTGGTLVDAYAGVGILGGVVAHRRGARLVAVEQHRGAVADARVNLADLDALVIPGEVGRWAPVTADVVIADPARTGLGRPGVTTLSRTGSRRLVLVSCDPASLGRDTALLAAEGYRLTTLQVVDAFAHTTHVEVVSRFDRDAAAVDAAVRSL
jgi:23S rRNA (uracil1939-C5)-methyltransferase